MRIVKFVTASAFLSVSALAAPAFAQEDGSFFQSTVGSLLGVSKPKEEIIYRERAPLVVPPDHRLRVPEQAGVKSNPNWPQDPDVQRKKKAAEDAKRPIVNLDPARKLSIEEIKAGRGVNPAANPDYRVGGNSTIIAPLSPDQLKAQGEAFRGSGIGNEKLVPGQEPKRKYLTDPPVGYRAPSANAAFAATKEKGGEKQDELSPYSFWRTRKDD